MPRPGIARSPSAAGWPPSPCPPRAGRRAGRPAGPGPPAPTTSGPGADPASAPGRGTSPPERCTVLAAAEAAIHHRGTYSVAYRVRRADGRYGRVEARGHLLSEDDGTPYRMIGSHWSAPCPDSRSPRCGPSVWRRRAARPRRRRSTPANSPCPTTRCSCSTPTAWSGDLNEGGRGLQLVAALAHRWGARYTAQGKVHLGGAAPHLNRPRLGRRQPGT
ncbi:PAS domain-containing protein [Streptomyces sp. RTd22]|uniref:PAS domain-containing protein n=1 Tax=Streptomyces sp. RTd22 TaxID=1841249 RepID=UPI00099FEB66